MTSLLRRVLQGVGVKAAADPKRLPMQSGNGSFMWTGDGGKGPRDTLTQMDAYGNGSWLFACVNRISEAVAASEWQLYRKSGAGRTEVASHPLVQLWNGVNEFYTREEFLQTSQQHLDLTGEAWWVILRNGAGVPVELWPIRPDRMTPVPDPQEYIKGYLYSIGNISIPLERDDVVFIRMPSPTDPYRGMGPVASLLSDLDSEAYAAQWTRNFFRNSAEPGGVIEFDQELSDPEFERLVARWQSQHRGVANAHRVAVLERGVWKDRKMSQREMEFTALRKLNRDIILGAFGMPASLLGITESVNRANAEAGEVMFSKWVIRPRLQRIRAAINERLCPLFGPDLEFDFVDPTPDNRELALAEADRGYRGGLLTRNEARRRLNEPETPDGDVFAPLIIAPGLSDVGEQLVGAPAKTLAPGRHKDADALLSTPMERAEARMQRAWRRRLADEAEKLTEYIRTLAKMVKDVAQPPVRFEPLDLDGYDWDWFGRYGDDVVKELSGVFTLSFRELSPSLEPTLAHRLSVQYAQRRAGDLLYLDGAVSLSSMTKERVWDLVASTIAEGESLNTLEKMLREELAFSRERAETIARTETATALGQGTKWAAAEEGRDQKHWVTQGDDLVDAPMCETNEAAGWIGADELFPSGDDTVPAHPRCRCVCRYRHSPASDVDAETDMVGEVRCPNQRKGRTCGAFLGRNLSRGGTVFCPKCSKEVVVAGDGPPEPEPPKPKVKRKTVERDSEGRIVAVIETEQEIDS